MAEKETKKQRPLTFAWDFFTSKFNDVDIFSQHISLNIDGKKSNISTTFGGCLTLIFYIAVILYVILQIFIWNTREASVFQVNDYLLDYNSYPYMEDKTLNMFDTSFNMFIGTTNKDINLLDNAYI